MSRPDGPQRRTQLGVALPIALGARRCSRGLRRRCVDPRHLGRLGALGGGSGPGAGVARAFPARPLGDLGDPSGGDLENGGDLAAGEALVGGEGVDEAGL